jgi:hypothetical protein
MDFIRHFSPLRVAMSNALSYNTHSVIKPHETVTILLMRTMKLTSIISLAFCLQVSAIGSAQGLHIRIKNVSLQKLFNEIEKKTGYTFFYDGTTLKETKSVTVVVKDATVEEILHIALAGQSLEYTIADKGIFVKKEQKAPGEAGMSIRIHVEFTATGSDFMGFVFIYTAILLGSLFCLAYLTRGTPDSVHAGKKDFCGWLQRAAPFIDILEILAGLYDIWELARHFLTK